MLTCKAIDCETAIKPSLLMCAKHWYMVPEANRTMVWRAWNEGEGEGTAEHVLACRIAIYAVAVKEGKMTREDAEDKLKKLREAIGAERPGRDTCGPE